MSTRIIQGTLVLPDRLLPRGQVIVEDGLIQDVVEAGRFDATLDLGSDFIAPGFIDLHVHGIGGADTMDATQDSLAHMAKRFGAHGVTGFLFTTMTASLDEINRVVAAVHQYMGAQTSSAERRAQAIGIHVEGPWIARDFKGAQDERHIRPATERAVNDLLTAANGAIRITTLAPEQPGGEMAVRLLREHQIEVSIGHTAATFGETMHAVDLGARHVTHCFNAMTGLHHREPGVVGAALLSRELYAELIADGVHVHPDAMRLLIAAKSRERVVLITDAMAAAERPDGRYELGGQEVVVHNGEARLQDGTLAGSTLVFDRAVRNLVNGCGISLVDVVHMASTTPAEAIGLAESKGKIRAGCDADLAILDDRLYAKGIVVSGAADEVIWSAA